MLPLHPSLDKDTSPQNILKVILKHGIKNVYIMSDESPEFFSSLKNEKNFNILFYYDFLDLIKLKQSNNYMLFCVEREIAEFASIRVSTFNTIGRRCRYHFHDYLCDSVGSS